MAVLGLEDMRKRLIDYVGDRTGDVDLELLEDVNDSFASYGKDQGEDWKSKYEENDSTWRKRYAERFRGGGEEAPTPLVETEEGEPKSYKYDDLFVEGGKQDA